MANSPCLHPFMFLVCFSFLSFLLFRLKNNNYNYYILSLQVRVETEWPKPPKEKQKLRCRRSSPPLRTSARVHNLSTTTTNKTKGTISILQKLVFFFSFLTSYACASTRKCCPLSDPLASGGHLCIEIIDRFTPFCSSETSHHCTHTHTDRKKKRSRKLGKPSSNGRGGSLIWKRSRRVR